MIYKLCLHHIALSYITLKPDNRHIKLNTFILLENADKVQEYFGALIHTLIGLQIIHRIQECHKIYYLFLIPYSLFSYLIIF